MKSVHQYLGMGRACTVASPERRLLRVFPASADASVMSMAFTVPSGVRPNELRVCLSLSRHQRPGVMAGRSERQQKAGPN